MKRSWNRFIVEGIGEIRG